MSRRHSNQRGSGFSSLYGLNQPSFHSSSSPNHYGFNETQLRPFSSGHGTVGNGYGKGVNQGQAHYLLPMSGAGGDSDTSSNLDSDLDYPWSDTSSNWDSDLEDYLGSDTTSDDDDIVLSGGNYSSDDDDLELSDDDDDDELRYDSLRRKDRRQRGGAHTGDHALPWRWFNPSTPMGTQAVNANNPLIPKVGPSSNSPTFGLSGGNKKYTQFLRGAVARR